MCLCTTLECALLGILDYATHVTVVAPVVESVNDSKQLPIIDIIVSFSRGEGLGKIGTRMEVTVIISLHEDPSTSKEGCICHDNEWALNIREV